MTDKNDLLYLDHIREGIERIREYTATGRDSFLADGVVQDACLRRLQTLAESTTRLTDGLKARHQQIPWSQIAGFRHRIVHDYLSSFDLQLAWTFIERDLLSLETVVNRELAAAGNEQGKAADQ